jgi:hypothetical protein
MDDAGIAALDSIRKAITESGMPPTIDGVQVGCVTEGLILIGSQLATITCLLERFVTIAEQEASRNE